METLSLFDKPLSKAERVKQVLKGAGLGGVSNAQLNHISFRYGSIIFNLRKEGHKIVTGPTDKNGLVRYYWHF